MNSLLKSKLVTLTIVILTIGLATFTPDFHLFGKIGWVIGNSLGKIESPNAVLLI